MPPQPEKPFPFQAPPVITEETRKILMEDMRLDMPASTGAVLEGITGDKQETPFSLARQIAHRVFSDIADVNRPFIEMMSQEIEQASPSTYVPFAADAITMGMGVTLRAFQKKY